MNRKMAFWLGLFGFTFVIRILPYALEALQVMKIDPETTWYPWNFSPLVAVCLFSGACVPDRRWAWTAPLMAFDLSNFAMWGLTGHCEFAFSPSQPLIMVTVIGIIALGEILRSSPKWQTALVSGVIAESIFFVVTNFAVWYFGEGGIYPLTFSGLMTCYAAGVPFFGRSLLSTSIFAGLLFSPVGLRMAGVQPLPLLQPEPIRIVA